jgi:hypothetical protein
MIKSIPNIDGTHKMSDYVDKVGFYFGIGVLSLFPLGLIYMSWEYTPYKNINRLIDSLKVYCKEPKSTDSAINELISKEAQINRHIIEGENKQNISKEEAEELRDKLYKLTSYPVLCNKINLLAVMHYYYYNRDIGASSYEKMKQSIVLEINNKEKYLTTSEISNLKSKLSECDKIYSTANERMKENTVEYEIFRLRGREALIQDIMLTNEAIRLVGSQ